MRIPGTLAMVLFAVMAFAQEAEPPLPTEEQLAEESAVGALVSVALVAYERKDYARMEAALERAVELRPHLAQLRFMLAKAHALQDSKTEAYNALVFLQRQGLSFTLEDDSDFDKLRGFELYDYLVEEFARNAQPFGEAENAFTIPRTDLLVETITADPVNGGFIIGSVTRGSLFRVDGEGRLTPFVEADDRNGLLGIADIEVDAKRGKLWVASGATPHVRHARLADRGATSLHRFDLATGRHEATYPAPQSPAYFIDLDVDGNGDVYAADSVRPMVWYLDASEADPARALRPFFFNPAFTGLRALTLDDSGEFLFVADYELGLYGVRIDEESLFRVDLGEQLNLAGVDALEWYQDSLIVLQNGVLPRRMLRFQLSPDRRQGRHSQPLLAAHPAFRNPVAATIADGRVYLIANSHRNGYDARTGEVLKGSELRPHQVLAVDPGRNWYPPR